MNFIVVFLFAILMLVSTEPQLFSQNVPEKVIAEQAAANTFDASQVTESRDSASALFSATLDGPQGFMQQRMAVSSVYLKDRFLDQ